MYTGENHPPQVRHVMFIFGHIHLFLLLQLVPLHWIWGTNEHWDVTFESKKLKFRLKIENIALNLGLINKQIRDTVIERDEFAETIQRAQ